VVAKNVCHRILDLRTFPIHQVLPWWRLNPVLQIYNLFIHDVITAARLY